MTYKELCEMCTEYSVNEKCDNKQTCKLRKILTENKKLKEENKNLRRELVVIRWKKYPEMMGR